ncbi:Yae1 domain-containing protein 1 [Nymphon striatum]|nr:Yae1 domain-containing protein 1 [Nymphon striatum]
MDTCRASMSPPTILPYFPVFIYVIDSKSSIDDFRNWRPLQGRKFKHNKYRHTVINRQQNSTTFKLQNKHRNNVSISAKIHTIIDGVRDGITEGQNCMLQKGFDISYNRGFSASLSSGKLRGILTALLANSNDFEDETQNKIKELISSLSKKEVELCSSNQESKKLLEANQNSPKLLFISTIFSKPAPTKFLLTNSEV